MRKITIPHLQKEFRSALALADVELQGKKPSWCNKLCRVVVEYERYCKALEDELKALKGVK